MELKVAELAVYLLQILYKNKIEGNPIQSFKKCQIIGSKLSPYHTKVIICHFLSLQVKKKGAASF